MGDPSALMSPFAAQVLAWVLIMAAWMVAYLRYGASSFLFLFLAGIWFYLLLLPYATGASDIRYGTTAFATATYYLSVPVYTFFFALAVRLVAPAAFRSRQMSAMVREISIPSGWKWCSAYRAFFLLSLALCFFSVSTRNVFGRDGDFLFTILGFDFLLVCYFTGRRWRGPVANLIFFVALTILFVYAGFRYRVAILFLAEITVYMSGRGSPLVKGLLIFVSAFAILALAAFGQVRSYGSFDPLSQLAEVNVDPLQLIAMSGEQTVYFATVNVIEKLEHLETIGFSPITLLISHFVPSAIWPDKPRASYLGAYLAVTDGLNDSGAAMHDIAQASLMFGHFGLPFAALLLGLIGGLMLRLGLCYSPNRYYTCALILLFAVFVPSRGYLAQQLTWMLSFVLPLILFDLARRLTFSASKARALLLS